MSIKIPLKVDHIFIISLKDNVKRVNQIEKFFKNRNTPFNFNLFDAIDTRTNPFLFEDYGFKLHPMISPHEAYFSQSFGAVGCYLSHYLIWENIKRQRLNNCLILEDDIAPWSLFKFLKHVENREISIDQQTDLLQLNQRCPLNKTHHQNNFDGTESYFVTNRGARKLLLFAKDLSGLGEVWDTVNFYNKDYPIDKRALAKKKCIQCPADKFLGFTSVANPKQWRVNIEIQPRISLKMIGGKQEKTLQYESDIVSPRHKPHWEMSNSELKEFEKTDVYRWWTKDRNLVLGK